MDEKIVVELTEGQMKILMEMVNTYMECERIQEFYNQLHMLGAQKMKEIMRILVKAYNKPLLPK